jgi:hypothetical protein
MSLSPRGLPFGKGYASSAVDFNLSESKLLTFLKDKIKELKPFFLKKITGQKHFPETMQ